MILATSTDSSPFIAAPPPRRGLRGLATLALVAGFALVGLSGGCEFQTDLNEIYSNIHPQRTDLIATGHVKGQAVSGTGVVVSLPTVWRENNDMLVNGTVTRRPGNDSPVPGFLDLQIVGPDGKQIDESLIHWAPEAIPTDGTRSALYHARMLGNAPAGSTVRVAYTEKVSDLETYNPSGAGGGGVGGRGAGHSGGGSHGGGGGHH